MSRSWIDDEPGWADAKQELRCVYARLRVRWKLALLITCVITVLGIGYRARKQRTFESTVVMRVTEVELDMSTAPPTSNQLQQHLSEVALSRRVLLKLINDNK
ncbi:MAG: Wzz/FepE/Etk N-terminal domain-containing protein, partial [Polyangiaceae bacterium]